MRKNFSIGLHKTHQLYNDAVNLIKSIKCISNTTVVHLSNYLLHANLNIRNPIFCKGRMKNRYRKCLFAENNKQQWQILMGIPKEPEVSKTNVLLI